MRAPLAVLRDDPRNVAGPAASNQLVASTSRASRSARRCFSQADRPQKQYTTTTKTIVGNAAEIVSRKVGKPNAMIQYRAVPLRSVTTADQVHPPRYQSWHPCC